MPRPTKSPTSTLAASRPPTREEREALTAALREQSAWIFSDLLDAAAITVSDPRPPLVGETGPVARIVFPTTVGRSREVQAKQKRGAWIITAVVTETRS